MARKVESIGLDDRVAAYIAAHASQPDEVLAELIVETARVTGDRSGMQVAPEQGSLLTLLVGLAGARNAVEVGTFTGYSSICIARGLPEDGRLLCCDVSEEWTSIARAAWERAGVADRIELRIAPAAETLASLAHDPPIDFAFIDADKRGYPTYYEELVARMRPGGLICVDNTLWSGRVADPSATDDDTVAIRAFNDAVAADDRVESSILPVADGLTLIRVR